MLCINRIIIKMYSTLNSLYCKGLICIGILIASNQSRAVHIVIKIKLFQNASKR